jgi:hypothetical protein
MMQGFVRYALSDSFTPVRSIRIREDRKMDAPTIGLFIASGSMLVSSVAVFNSARQAKRSADLAHKAITRPVLASLHEEFRSEEFRSCLRTAMELELEHPTDPSVGISGLDDEVRQRVYSACYFFEYLSLLVAFGHVPEDMVVATMSTQLMQTWDALEPWIQGEREVRAEFSSPGVSPVFLAFYENLVARILDLGGAQASTGIHQRMKLRRIPPRSQRPRLTPEAIPNPANASPPRRPKVDLSGSYEEHSS